MGSIYKSLTRANNLQPLADTIGKYIQKKQYERDMMKLNDMYKDSTDNINTAFNNSPLYGVNTPNADGDFVLNDYAPEKAPQRANQEIAKFLTRTMDGTLGNNIDPNAINNRVGALMSLTKAMTPAKKSLTQMDPYKDTYTIDEFGNSSLTKSAKEKVTPKRAEQFKVSADGYYMYWDEDQNDFIKTNQKAPLKDYTFAPKEGGKDEKNNNKLLSKVNEGIVKIKNLKNSKWVDGQGYYLGKNKDGLEQYAQQNDLNMQRDKLKEGYVSDAITLINSSGLGDVVESIRPGMQKGLSPEEAVKAYRENDPSISDEEATILIDYFTLMTL